MAEIDKMSQGELVRELKKQVAMQNIQMLLSRMSHICFKKCVTQPEFSLDRSEQKCISMCMDRYLETVSLVSKSYGEQLVHESQNT